MGNCIEYKPDETIIKVAGREIFSWVECEAERSEPEWVLERSTNGRSSFRHQPAQDGVIRLVIHQEGVEDWLFIRQLAASGQQFNVNVVDMSGTKDSVVGERCHVEVQPPFRRGNEAVTYEVRFLACRLIFEPSTQQPTSDLDPITV